jgi:hypothetical protein
MRRVTLMLAAVAMMVSLFAVVAYAGQIQGTENSEQIGETSRGDTIKALAGDDGINAAQFETENGDRDRAHGNKGDDDINVQDGDGKDIAFGGKGHDDCLVDTAESVGNGGDKFFSCETVNGVPQ